MFILFSHLSGRLWSTVQNALFWWSWAYSQLNLSMAMHWGQAGSEASTQASCPSESSKGAERQGRQAYGCDAFLGVNGRPSGIAKMRLQWKFNPNFDFGDIMATLPKVNLCCCLRFFMFGYFLELCRSIWMSVG